MHKWVRGQRDMYGGQKGNKDNAQVLLENKNKKHCYVSLFWLLSH